jgi:hypothetical protein
MRVLLAAIAAAGAMSAAAQAQTFKFTAAAVGGDNFKTVYYSKGVAAAVQVCTIDKPVHVRAHIGAEVNISTITSMNECTVVVAEKVTVVPYVVQHPSATVSVTILGVAGIYNPNP